MKTQRIIPFLFAALLLVFTSCDKDDEDKEPSRSDLLTTGLWTGSSVYIQGQDISQLLRDSANFDVRQLSTRFDKNGEYRETFGRTIVGTWEFVNNEQEILFDKGTNQAYTVKINKLNATELYYEQEIDGLPFEFRFSH
ncbi:hypothetical protein H9Q13_01465 [Pontibacter sp. JH31]|uniref:Lipocalin-like domain-containing protein n=1 Tax=Pontibacter aquaedesilientis TaxID=2766980 RepID=A0ABR7XBZ5_9BACT|nr:hypothetical protein [Pontibacter aquaedesilientis]MBD1395819.1 hypothetical protein [Pontibacter aquaedesilientis]